ncbi:hypothetical protein [Nostoc sp. MG11]|nr:hypothetical protein [Nostoc sp. MG11]
MIPSSEELAEQESLRAQQAEQEIARLREVLRAQGINQKNI